MITLLRQRAAAKLAWLALGLLLALPASAQRGGGGGGFGGGGFGGGGGGGFRGGGGGSTAASSTRTYAPNGTLGDAIFSVDPETKRIMVITDEETSQYVQQVITNLDRPKPQVLIKVVFLEVTHNDSRDIGVEGGFNKSINRDGTVANGANAFGASGLSAATNSSQLLNMFGQPVANLQPSAPYSGAGLYQVVNQDYQATLRLIAQAGNAKVLSRPSIMARHNQPATILVGQSVPMVGSSRVDTYGNIINSITYQDVGIILKVTPFITPDGFVEMIVSPEISAVSQTDRVQIQGGAYAPFIDKRSADTVVVTPSGHTVIIGGLMQNQKTQSESKVPLLGDIPGLGFLFKRKITTDNKTELIIFMTPHIVAAPSQLAALSEQEKSQYGAPKEFSEEELNKFLEKLPAKTPEGGDKKTETPKATAPKGR